MKGTTDISFDSITLDEAVGEVNYFIENGGICQGNCLRVHRIVTKFGANAHETFQEAIEQIATLVAEGLVAESDLVSAQSN